MNRGGATLDSNSSMEREELVNAAGTRLFDTGLEEIHTQGADHGSAGDLEIKYGGSAPQRKRR